MKRLFALVLSAIIVMGLAACGSGHKKISGMYKDRANDDYKYDFAITDSGRGDYGGMVTRYYRGEERETWAWYVEDDIVYLDGDASFIYRNGYMYDDYDAIDGITVTSEGRLTGNNQKAKEGKKGAVIFTDDLALIKKLFLTAKAIENDCYYFYWDYSGNPQWGMYAVDGNTVNLYAWGITSSTPDYVFYIVDNTLYKSRLEPI